MAFSSVTRGPLMRSLPACDNAGRVFGMNLYQVMSSGNIGRIIMRCKLTLIVLMCCSVPASAACDPIVYAICRIKLFNGNSTEGIISITGKDCSGVWMNGLQVQDGEQTSNYFFALDFNRFIARPDRSVRLIFNDGRTVDSSKLSRRSRIVFLERVGDQAGLKGSKEVAGTFLLRPTHPESRYRKLHSLTIFTRLTEYLFLPNTEDAARKRYKGIRIPVEQIATIELLKKPPEKWLAYIRQKRRANPCYVKEACEDYAEPEWYHEILADKERYNHIKEMSEETLKRAN